MVKEDLQNPIMASVAATFPMALMLLSTYIKPFIGSPAKYIWFFAIALHLILIIYFTLKFILKLQMPKVFASYFIVYVGIAVAAVTAPAFEDSFLLGWCISVRICYLIAFVGTCNDPLCKVQADSGTGSAIILHLCSAYKPLCCRICAVRHTKIKRIFINNAGTCNCTLCDGAH